MKKLGILLLGVVFVACMMPQNGVAQQDKIKKKENHFIYTTSAALLGGMGNLVFDEGRRSLPNNKSFVVDVHQVLAYQFNPYFTLGLGVGVDVWRYTAFIPLYAHMNVNFINKPVTPHFYLNAGYAFKWYVSEKPEKGTKVIHGNRPGLQGETGIGVKIKMKENLAFYLLAHYKLQQSVIRFSDETNTAPGLTTNKSENMLYHFVGLKVAVSYF